MDWKPISPSDRLSLLGMILGALVTVATTDRTWGQLDRRAPAEMTLREPAEAIRDQVQPRAASPSPLPVPRDRAPVAEAMSARLIGQGTALPRVEEQLQAVFRGRLQSESSETQRVYRIVSEQRVLATLIFDDRRNGILTEATPAVLDQLELLIAVFDQQDDSDQRTAIVSIERTEPSKLQQALDAYRRTRPTAAPNDSSLRARPRSTNPQYSTTGLALVNFVFQEPANSAGPPPGPEPQQAENLVPGAAPPAAPVAPGAGGLDVDVDVQTLPDLDVIILRGRDRDVQKLTEIIQELERLSQETQPQVQVYLLSHANSLAVTEILQDVAEDLTGRRQGRVSVTALVKPNGILLIGWGDAVEAMINLIRQLDTPVAEGTQFQVYRLEHAPAVQVVATITQFFANREALGPRVLAVADVRTNSVIVYAAPRDMLEVDRLIESLDTSDSKAVNRARVVPIRHALAADIAQTLEQAIQASTGANDPASVLELLTIDPGGEELIRSGILTDVRITPNVRNNSLIISGPPDSIPLLLALIEQLDVPGAVSQIKVFRIMNGDAANMVRMLRSLLPAETSSNLGPQLPTAEGETSLAPLRFSVDTRTNSIIATGSDGDLRIIEALLLRLDERDLAERQTEVYRLRNAPAIDVAISINEFLRSERVLQLATPGDDSPFEQIEREVVVVPEPVGNSLIISATPRYFDDVMDIIEDLDRQPPQVMIQVLIAEIELDNAHEFGVELGIQDSVLFDRSLLGDLVTTTRTSQVSTPSGIVTTTEQLIQAATNVPGFDFNNQPLGNSGSTRSLSTADQVAGQALSSFAVGRVNNQLGFGGLVLSASSESISVLIRALQESRRLDVLSRPQVRTLDNQPAFIQVGQRVPRITQSNLTDGGLQTNQVELENVGLILGVTPRISPDGTVVMEIDAEKSSLGPEDEGIPITVSADGTVIRSPRIDTATAQTTVSAASGETIILGGLITKSTRAITRRVPYLADIPILGELFRYDGTFDQRTELLIILTPYVIRNPEDSERISQMEMARMSWCAADVFSLHGEISMPLEATPLFQEPTEVIYPHIDPRGEGISPPEPLPELAPPRTYDDPIGESILDD